MGVDEPTSEDDRAAFGCGRLEPLSSSGLTSTGSGVVGVDRYRAPVLWMTIGCPGASIVPRVEHDVADDMVRSVTHQVVHHATMSIFVLVPGLVAVLLLACLLIRLLAPFLDGLDFPDSDGPDPGFGGGGQPPSAPPPSTPCWWPEFEREFASYVATRPGPRLTGSNAHSTQPRVVLVACHEANRR